MTAALRRVALSAVVLFCTVCSAATLVKASVYAHSFDGHKTASGSTYTPYGFTAAHLTLPFGTRLRLVNTKTHRTVVVTVTDRGPFSKVFGLDLSPAAASRLGITKKEGWAWVTYRVVGRRKNH